MQAGTVHAAMLLIARIVLGTGMGHILVGTPMYQAEIAPTASRGLMVGMHACLLGGGIALAQWMGVAFFHVKGQASWRAPLAIQCAPAVLFLCFSFLLPESPRWRKFKCTLLYWKPYSQSRSLLEWPRRSSTKDTHISTQGQRRPIRHQNTSRVCLDEGPDRLGSGRNQSRRDKNMERAAFTETLHCWLARRVLHTGQWCYCDTE
jgi:MFS family permease